MFNSKHFEIRAFDVVLPILGKKKDNLSMRYDSEETTAVEYRFVTL